MKYRLKKDTPAFRSGYIFETDPKDDGILLDKEGVSAFYENEVEHFDEWFEEVKESGWWKPKSDEKYYFLSNVGEVIDEPWLGNWADKFRYLVGNCFKTKDAAERYRDYLEAITTVRQDEGVLTPEQAAENGYAYYIHAHYVMGLRVHGVDSDYISVGAVLFDTREHAQASLDNHPDEWKIIANYDWSRE